ncbi:hypothetical protein EDC96DRAFT_501325 [Choanephora cucurbitarum]|nr:hypothetical protein EDC96DRAFT_501325 [Choanephora cucurbitarum]
MLKLAACSFILSVLYLSVTNADPTIERVNEGVYCKLQNGTLLSEQTTRQLLEGLGQLYNFEIDEDNQDDHEDISNRVTLEFKEHGRLVNSDMFDNYCEAVDYYLSKPEEPVQSAQPEEPIQADKPAQEAS